MTNTRICRQRGNPFIRKPPPPPPPTLADPAAMIKKQMVELAKNSALLGNVKAITSKFRMTPAKASMLLSGIAHAIQWEELFFFAFMGWAFVPLLGIPQTLVRDQLVRRGRRVRTFARSYSKLIADNVASISRIGFVVYIADIIKILLQAMGFKYPHLKELPIIVAKSLVRERILNVRIQRVPSVQVYNVCADHNSLRKSVLVQSYPTCSICASFYDVNVVPHAATVHEIPFCRFAGGL